MVNVTLHPPGETPGPQQPAPAQAPAPQAPAAPRAVETPSQSVVRAANALTYVTDEQGRQIGWRKLSALDDFDLCEIAGGNASNREWMMRASLAFSVREINGEQIARPATKAQLRALVARLDDAGMVAVGQSVYGPIEDAAADEDLDRAKN